MTELNNDVVIQQLNSRITEFLSNICDIANKNKIDELTLLTLVNDVISNVITDLTKDMESGNESNK